MSGSSGAPWPSLGIAGTVLLVEDDPGKRYVVARILSAGGYEVTEARDGSSALALARQNPDLIVLDVRLPDVSGYDLCRRLKADAQTSSIMILQLSSTFATGSDKIAGLDSGADAYLTHPVEPPELLATLAALMRIRRAERERSVLLQREQAARMDADRANRLKDEFLATISHELRTPLNAILGWVRLLRSGRLEAAAHGRALETIERNAHTQAQLIEDLLDMSRILSGKLALEAQPVDLAMCMSMAIESVRLAAEAKGIQIDLTVDPGVEPIVGDPTRLQQVVWNLLSNAIKFTPRGGRIEAQLSHVNGSAEIRVQDNGQGISAEFLPHVFERFRQAESTTRRSQGGIGLGLAIVHQLVESHGGTVRADSPGTDQGATFMVRLPRRASVPPLIPTTARAPAIVARPPRREIPAAELPAISGIKVLVVDDEVDARDYLATVLGQAGAEIRVAGSASVALALLERWTPDVLLGDIAMPDQDGYDLIRAVRGLAGPAARIPAAALTAYAKVEDRRRALLAGYHEHLAKPVDPADVVVLVAKLARRGIR